MSIQNWSPKEKLALVPGVLAILLAACIAMQEKRPETKVVDSRPELHIARVQSPDAIPSTPAPFYRRSTTPIALAADKPLGKLENGYGECPAFQHKHPTREEAMKNPYFASTINSMGAVLLDGLCHDDATDLPVTDRPRLPKPDPKKKWL